MINKKIDSIWQDLSGDSLQKLPVPLGAGIPTLEKEKYRPFSPQLKARFLKLGAWLNSTHGDWLDLHEMTVFWNQSNADERLLKLYKNVLASIENWQDDAGSIFKSNRISVFAASADHYERIYLVWFDSCLEPELWVYDVNGEQRFKDLDTYLTAYIGDDLSHVGVKWKLG